MNKIISLVGLILLPLLMLQCTKDRITSDDPANLSLEHINHNPTALTLETPEFFDPMPIPDDNALTVEGVDLGRHLFYDPLLSIDSTISCSTCHQLANNFSNKSAFASNGLTTTDRSVLSLTNVGYVPTEYFYDGRASTLEEAILQEIEDPKAMNGAFAMAIERIQRSIFYHSKFRRAFPIKNTSEISPALISKAIAQFLRTLVSANAPLDKAQSSNSGGFQLTDLEVDGYFLFFREVNFTPHPGCSHCHDSPYFMGDRFTNNGLDAAATLNDFVDFGRGAVTANAVDNGRFKAPSLRNIALTAPYMHDGRFETLEEVIEHYRSGGHPSLNVDQEITGFELSAYEKDALIAFLNALTDEDFLQNEDFQSPF